MNESQRKEIKELLTKRLKLFYLLIPSLLVVCLEASGMVYGKINKLLTRAYGTIENFGVYYLLLCFALYLIFCFIAYKGSLYPIRKDYKNGILLQYKAQITGKQHFEHVGKYFLLLGTLPPYNKTEVSAGHYAQTETGDWLTLSVAPNTAYFFDDFGKHYLL